MTGRKKTNLSKVTKKALELQNKRRNESLQQLHERRSLQSERQRLSRASETEEHAAARRFWQTNRQSVLRAGESEDQAYVRRFSQAQRQMEARSIETMEQTDIRRSGQVQRQSALRESESEVQAVIRRITQAQLQSELREVETPEQANARRHEQAQRQSALRSAETLEQANARRHEQAQRQSELRAAETAEQANARRHEQSQRQSELRAEETAEQAGMRRSEDSQRHLALRTEETVIEADLRRINESARMAIRRRNFKRANWSVFERAAFDYDINLDYSSHKQLDIGKMVEECRYCTALKWKAETPGMCCSSGKVDLPLLEEPPEPLNRLLLNESNDSKVFLKSIRKYNSSFQMTSFGADKDASLPGFSPTFRIQGQIYHRIGSIFPLNDQEPTFLQIYFMGDEDLEAERRCRVIPGIERTIVDNLQRLLHTHNDLIRSFKTAIENMPNESYKILIQSDRTPRGEHERRYNVPVVNEIAALVVGNLDSRRDIVLHARNGNLMKVYDTHRFYDALQYPIIFWSGQEGYHFQIPQVDASTRTAVLNKKVSCMDFYAFHLMIRRNNFNLLMRYRQLFHQFLVDIYVKVENERLRYITLNQQKLRSESYIHLQDAVNNDANVNPNNLGQLVILPSSFINSPRYLHEYTQDAFAYVRVYGRPDLFLTFTCNPSWKEITDELMPGQRYVDRHDLIARVFRQKLQKFVAILTKGNIFGEHLCFMYSVEWQKRGLPHVHLLLWLKNKIRADEIDKIICAEIPNPHADKELHDIVLKNMVHGPCGRLNPLSPCMKNGKCTKKYPRPLMEETQHNENGYPLYRRRAPSNGGQTAKIKIRGMQEELTIDNTWIVPYCPLLSKTFKAHINIELCSSVKAIKYICKYINKGSDQAIFNIQQEQENPHIRNEVQVYQAGRYVSSNEAAWRLFRFPLHERYPTVSHLAVHLENGERVYFNERNFQQRVSAPPKTTMTAFFELCKVDDFAKTLLYVEVPKYYTWNTSLRVWKRRKMGRLVNNWPGIKKADAIGRVYTVHVRNMECYCLRMLLHNVRGPTSFADLKRVNDHTCETFREACEELGLMENDAQWDLAMSEAVLCSSPYKLRELFAILISLCGISKPNEFWQHYKNDLSEDILRQKQINSSQLVFDEEIYNEALRIIEDKIISMVGKDLSQFGIPRPHRLEIAADEVTREMNYDSESINAHLTEMIPKLTAEQNSILNQIMRQISKEEGALFFLDAPGGTGKTFVLNLLLSQIRKDGNIAIAVASSGIAATLLHGGRTAHSVLKLPLNLAQTETPNCNISKNSGLGVLLQKCQLIVWDECTMSHKHAIEALNRSLQDIRSCDRIMGGMVVLLAGDFRQTLPVVPRGTPADEINSCLKASPLWNKVIKMSLTANMRVHVNNDADAGTHASELLNIGNGNVFTDENGEIKFQNGFCNLVLSEDELISKVYPDINQNINNEDWLCERALLAPKNATVSNINNKIISKVFGPSMIYTSVDMIMDEANCTAYPPEFLNSIELSGVPSHKLELKIGVPIMLMRNLSAPKLCNGTRLRVTHLSSNLIGATILTGSSKGEEVFIPRIPIIPTDLPFQFKRLQFPVKLAFGITINKSQGQTLKIAGVHLETPCFSHGQLYVACSRVPSGKNLYILAPNGKTRNVVYRSVLSSN